MVESRRFENGENYSQHLILKSTAEVLKELAPVTGGEIKNSIFGTVDYSSFVAQAGLNNLEVYGIKPGSHVAFEITSPYSRSIKGENDDSDWFKYFNELYFWTKENNKEFITSIKTEDFRESLEIIQVKSGMSPELTLNHMPYSFKEARKYSLMGATLVAFDFKTAPQDRTFIIWDSEFNTLRDADFINELVESIDDRVIEDIYAPVY